MTSGGGDFFKWLLPQTHAWAALEAVRKAARRVDGLSVVRWIAEAHGGAARLLESERGAAFEVSLPA